jgi:hypothetical protein
MDRSSIRRASAHRLAEGGGCVDFLLNSLARFVPSLGGWARRIWCQHQRRQLIGVTTRVLWVSPERVPWVKWAGTLLYLRGR